MVEKLTSQAKVSKYGGHSFLKYDVDLKECFATMAWQSMYQSVTQCFKVFLEIGFITINSIEDLANFCRGQFLKDFVFLSHIMLIRQLYHLQQCIKHTEHDAIFHLIEIDIFI